MIKKYFKKYKLNQIQQIKQTNKYIYLFRYNDITTSENIFLKKKLKELKFKSLILKQNLIKNNFININGQGSIIIIYGNNDINLINSLLSFKKLEFVYLLLNGTIFSNLKFQKIFSKSQIPLNISLIKPFLNFLYYLRKI